jgi:hypothetical protein
VTYRAGDGSELRVAWLVAERKVRLDLPDIAVLHDMPANTATTLAHEQRTVVQESGDPGGLFFGGLVQPDEQLIRQGAARIANHDCTEWRILWPDSGQRGKLACMTEDGVPLRLVVPLYGPAWLEVLAVRVEYGPQDPARFRVPEGYRLVDPSAFVPQQRH